MCGLRLFPLLSNSFSLAAKEITVIPLLYMQLQGYFSTDTVVLCSFFFHAIECYVITKQLSDFLH